MRTEEIIRKALKRQKDGKRGLAITKPDKALQDPILKKRNMT